jgi:hypothetical protein
MAQPRQPAIPDPLTLTTQRVRAVRMQLSGETQSENVKKVPLSKTSYYGRVALVRWIQYDAEEINGDVTGPLVPRFRATARSISLNRAAEIVFYFAILVAGICSGIQTDSSMTDNWVVLAMEWGSLSVFFVEVLLKLLAESSGKPLAFFQDAWNGFDFVLLLGLLVATPAGQGEVASIRILRMLRAIRLLRAARLLPKLTLVLETLIRSASSVLYIALFLLLVMYIFAIIGVTMFASNDVGGIYPLRTLVRLCS